jgi:hypothetical protein
VTGAGGGEPLRKEIRIPIYWLIVGLCVMVVSPLASIYASVKINQKTIAQSEHAQDAARVQALAVYCRLLGTQVDVYSEATTDVGKRAYGTWLAEYRRTGCQPGK